MAAESANLFVGRQATDLKQKTNYVHNFTPKTMGEP